MTITEGAVAPLEDFAGYDAGAGTGDLPTFMPSLSIVNVPSIPEGGTSNGAFSYSQDDFGQRAFDASNPEGEFKAGRIIAGDEHEELEARKSGGETTKDKMLAAMADAHEAAMERIEAHQREALAANRENWLQSEHSFGGQSMSGKLIEEIQDMYKRDSAYREKVDAAMRAKGYSQQQIDQAAANSERLVQLQQLAAAGVLTAEQQREMLRLANDQATRDMQGAQANVARKHGITHTQDATAVDTGASAVASTKDRMDIDALLTTPACGDADALAMDLRCIVILGAPVPPAEVGPYVTRMDDSGPTVDRSFAETLTDDTVAQTNQPASETVTGQRPTEIILAQAPTPVQQTAYATASL